VTDQAKPMTPLEHIRRAEELLDIIDNGEAKARSPEWYTIQVAIAHLHLRAAEVGAKLGRTISADPGKPDRGEVR
jgi:hypothetical protein